MENVRKHRDIKLVTNEARRNHLVTKPNYHTTKSFSEDLLAIKIKKHKYYRINYSVYYRINYYRINYYRINYFSLSILEISTIGMNEFLNDYAKAKYRETKTWMQAKHIETRLDTLNY